MIVSQTPPFFGFTFMASPADSPQMRLVAQVAARAYLANTKPLKAGSQQLVQRDCTVRSNLRLVLAASFLHTC